jgi:hypothetical protein
MLYRRNADEELRRLERLAALGDIDALRRFRQMRRRISYKPRPFYHCLTWLQLYELFNLDLNEFDEKHHSHFWEASHGKAQFMTNLDEEATDEVRFEIEYLLTAQAHDSIRENIIECVKQIVKQINEWAARGLQTAHALKPQRHKTGLAIELEIFWKRGDEVQFDIPVVCFQLYRPFLSVSVDAYHGMYGLPDEGRGLRDMTAKDVIRVGRLLGEITGGNFCGKEITDVDIHNLDVSHTEVEEIVEKLDFTDEDGSELNRNNPAWLNRRYADRFVLYWNNGSWGLPYLGRTHCPMVC